MGDPTPLLPSTASTHFAGLEEKLGFWEGVVSLMMSMVGTGIATFPYAFSLCGYIAGPASFAIFALLAYLSYVMLVKCTKKLQVASYGGLVQKVSNAWAYYTKLALWPLFNLAAASYVIICGDILMSIAGYLFEEGSFQTFARTKECLFAVILSLQFPICLFRSFKGLSLISMYCSCALSVVVILIVYKTYYIYSHDPPLNSEAVTASFEFDSVCLAVPIFACAMFGHMNISQIYAELRPNVKMQAPSVVLAACLGATLLYFIVGIVGYAAFGRNTRSDVVAQITAHSGEDGIIIVIQSLLASFIFFKTPLLILPLRNLTIAMVAPNINPLEVAAYKHIGLTFGLLVCVYIASVSFPLLGTCLTVNGIITVIPLTFVVPARISWSIEVPRPVVQCLALAVAGVAASMVSLVVFTTT